MEREALLAANFQPGDRPAAPPPLDLVQAFVNTVDREHGPDLLDDAGGLAEWLARRRLGDGAGPTTAELRRARDVREALRTLLYANVAAGAPGGGEAGAPHAPSARAVAGAVATLDAAAARARLRARFATARLEPEAGGVDGAIGALLATAFAARADGTLARLKACPREVCGWAFYDRSPTASATWCSMRVCGGRTKAQAYYRRRTAR